MIYCFDIGGTAIKGAIAASPTDIRPLPRVATPLGDFDSFAAAIAGVIATRDLPANAGVSISITGVVDPDTGIIKVANIPGIDGLPLAAQLSSYLKRPVTVANDADCFALAEAIAGAGKGHRIVFGVILGTGVGGGLVIDGKILQGAGGFAGEWGHGPVAATHAGNPAISIPQFACGCGQVGCVDTIGAARGMERLHKHIFNEDLASVAIVDNWLAGDRSASRTIDCFIDLVASPLALVLNVVGASIVPVGGGLANAPALIQRLDQAVRSRVLRHADKAIVVPGQCTLEAGLIGAGVLGLTEFA
jgi:N-acetylglucosamine kinase